MPPTGTQLSLSLRFLIHKTGITRLLGYRRALCAHHTRPLEALSTPAAIRHGGGTSGGLMYCCLHGASPTQLPSAPGSSESEDKAQFFVRGVPRGPQVPRDSPRTVFFVPPYQGTGPTLDAASCLPVILTLHHTVFWPIMASRGHGWGLPLQTKPGISKR